MRHTISVLVENEFGVLSRVAGLFSGRGFNIESLCVAESTDKETSRMTIVTRGNEQIIEQIKKQLNKLINVIKVVDHQKDDSIERELVLVKVTAEGDDRAEILRLVDIFRSKVVDVTPKSYTVEITGDEMKIESFIEILRPMGIKEIARTGRIAMGRGARPLK